MNLSSINLSLPLLLVLTFLGDEDGLLLNALFVPSASCCAATAFTTTATFLSHPTKELNYLWKRRSEPGRIGSIVHLRFSLDSSIENEQFQSPPSQSPSNERELSIVERCYDAWNQRKMEEATSCFADDFVYDDGQYLGKITNKSDLKQLFQTNAQTLPSGSIVVIDDIAICHETGNIGTRWHAETKDGSDVPLTRGCSFYTTDETSGLIKTGFKVSEMVVKPSKGFSNGIVSSTSKLTEASNKLLGVSNSMVNPKSTLDGSSSESIIEEYFKAWNRRDMEAALDCFVDDCIYETEDPIFVDAFQGKAALREHLLNNAAALPSSCQIILDDLAIDRERGTFGVKWHLEVSGVAIPNLRGCSMYTTKEDVELLKSGFDVTESPVKIPGLVKDFLSFPLSKILF